MGIFSLIFGDTSKIGLNNKANRHNWIQHQLQNIPAQQTILDAGAGELQFKKYCSHLRYMSQDFGQYDGKGDGVGIQTTSWDNSKLDIVSDIASIPVVDSSFDNILCTEVLEHIPHPAEAIKEFARIIKPGGKLILTAPFCSLTHFAPYHFYSGFNEYFYEKYLKDFGFDIVEINPNGNYFEYIAQELRFSQEVALKYAGLKWSLKNTIAQKILLNFYHKASARDSKSSGLLNFGFHIIAVKK